MNNADINIKTASEDECKRFSDGLNNPDLFPITHTVTINVVEFINMKEFNNMKIKGAEYEKTKIEYLDKKSHYEDLKRIARDTAARFSELGLFPKQIKVSGRSFGIKDLLGDLHSILETLKK